MSNLKKKIRPSFDVCKTDVDVPHNIKPQVRKENPKNAASIMERVITTYEN